MSEDFSEFHKGQALCNDLVAKLKQLAEKKYQDINDESAPTNTTQNSFFSHLNQAHQEILTFKKAANYNYSIFPDFITSKLRVDEDALNAITHYVDNKKIRLLASSNFGAQSIVLNGIDEKNHPVCVRISFTNTGERTRLAETAFVLQPYHSSVREGIELDNIKVEILPRVAMLNELNFSNEENQFIVTEFRKHLPDGFYIKDLDKNNLGLLPDGTIIIVDPDAIDIQDNKKINPIEKNNSTKTLSLNMLPFRDSAIPMMPMAQQSSSVFLEKYRSINL